MIEWFNSLDAIQKIFWACAIIGSIFFVIQVILLFIGLDSDADIATDTPDFDGDTTDVGGGFSLFSIKNLVNFIVGFGWGGVCLRNTIENSTLLTIVALFVGFAFIGIFFVIYKQTRKLETNGAFRIADCLDKVADVYLRIPNKGEGKGKVQISVNGSIHEIDALSNDTAIATGAKVKIIEIIDETTVKVENI